MTRRRSINQIMNSERIANRLSSRRFSKKRTKVPCYCDKYNGKLVILRTKMLYKAAENTTDSNLNSSLAGPEKLYIKVTGKKSENHMNANHLMIGQLAIYSHVSAPKTEKGKIFTQIFLFLRTNT
ncbi:uncharacterized protein OCT59_028096 [Rhizophagus irregularis]|uniref:uncharacterized protein n=1 Tax=Rhizophagus irregularis TaxID=588596 RepID=UPI0033185CA9|nr:hypothetical protein OCT59_028096 [Rhizophagus irregularis]